MYFWGRNFCVFFHWMHFWGQNFASFFTEHTFEAKYILHLFFTPLKIKDKSIKFIQQFNYPHFQLEKFSIHNSVKFIKLTLYQLLIIMWLSGIALRRKFLQFCWRKKREKKYSLKLANKHKTEFNEFNVKIRSNRKNCLYSLNFYKEET